MTAYTKVAGTLGELAVAKDLIKQGHEVFMQVGDYSVVDMIALVNKKPVRIQVKTVLESRIKNVANAGATKIRGGKRIKYAADDFDIVAVYVVDRDEVAYVPMSLMLSTHSQGITLRFEGSPHNNGRKVHWFAAYKHLAVV